MQHTDKKTFAKRRNHLFSRMNDGQIAVVFSASHKVKTNDVCFEFRQNNDFWYLTGFPESSAIGVFFKDKGQGKFWLFCQQKDPLKELWEGVIIGPEKAGALYGADKSFSIADFSKGFKSNYQGNAQDNPKSLFSVNDIDMMFDNPENNKEKLLTWLNGSEFELLNYDSVIYSSRLLKDPYEIHMIKQVVDLSVDAHKKVMKSIRSFKYEYEIEALLTYEFHSSKCRHAYLPIVASGANSCVLHYTSNHCKLNIGDLLLIDAGAECENYASDITRTFPISGKFTDEQKAIYDLVLYMQCSAIEIIKPGIRWDDIQNHIVRTLVQGLIDLKLLSGSIDQNIENKDYRRFYPHSFGHWLGLDVHDVGGYVDEKGESVKLQEGMVLTVEPGIYINRLARDIEPKWRDIGIRIEDNVVVTTNGCDVLSKDLPKSIEEIERICSG